MALAAKLQLRQSQSLVMTPQLMQSIRLLQLTHVELERFIAVIEQAAGRPALKEYRPMQPGDMVETMADTSRAHAAFGFDPRTPIEAGLPTVVHWCRDYFGDAA